MKVAIYYPWVYLPGGPERTIMELLARSRHEWTVITNRYERDVTFPELRNAKIIELPRVSVNRSMSRVFEAAFRIGIQKLPLEDQDALIVFCEGLGDFVLFRNHSIPTACLCFTPLRAAFDEHYASRYLEMAGDNRLRRFLLAAASFVYRRIDRFLWRRYQLVFAISKEVRRRILAGGLCGAGKIDLLHPGVDTRRLVPDWQYNREFLIPGRIMWTKNLELAIDAFRLFTARRPDTRDLRLTIAGWVDKKSENYAKRLKESAADTPQIRFVESPSDAELFGLCQSCLCVLYPPFNEDWGLIPLEAMSFGKPVIAVNRGGPEETVADGVTGFLVDATPEAFASAMERIADDPELTRRMGLAGRHRAELFDWARFTEKMDHQIDRLVSAAPRSREPQPVSPPQREAERRIARPARIVKRAIDICLASLILVLGSPLYLAVALLILILEGRPVFYVSQRYVSATRAIPVYKFRTMVRDATSPKYRLKERYMRSGYLDIPLTCETYTPIGRFLERSQIVELPQMLNILVHGMSLIGNRPMPLENLQLLRQFEGWEDRFASPCGISGIAQIAGKLWITPEQRMSLETGYSRLYRNGNVLYCDMVILYYTLRVILRAWGLPLDEAMRLVNAEPVAKSATVDTQVAV